MYSLSSESIQMKQEKLLQLKKYLTKQELQMPLTATKKIFLVPKLERGYRHLNSGRAHNRLTWFKLESLVHHQRVMVHIITSTIQKCLPRWETLTIGRVRKVRKSIVSGAFSSRNYRLKTNHYKEKQKENSLGFGLLFFYVTGMCVHLLLLSFILLL